MQKCLLSMKIRNCTFNILYDCIIMILLGQIREIGLNVIIIAEEKKNIWNGMDEKESIFAQ